MPKIAKIFTSILLLAVIFQTGAVLYLSLFHLASNAKEWGPRWVMPDPQITIPGLENGFSAPTCTGSGENQTCKINWLAEYIAAIYKYAIGVVGILAAIVIMVGGIIWITSGGNASQVGEAKSWITGALTGLILALCSYIILYQVNPDLLKLNSIDVKIVKKTSIDYTPSNQTGCCWHSSSNVCSPCINATTQATSINEPITFYPGDSECVSCKSRNNISHSYGGNWEYDNDVIKSQKVDASPELNNLLNCMRPRLPEGVGRISSISDQAGLANCRDNWTDAACAHEHNSCHYGAGETGALSQAVDFGDENYKDWIIGVANQCNAGYVKDEGDHIHVSTAACKNN